ncbi:MAG TPA: hypothetical protein VFQ53_01360 [Kofleriaceae bacterium]|nr:hypothetical protein [Kofleriaceae bacterium]
MNKWIFASLLAALPATFVAAAPPARPIVNPIAFEIDGRSDLADQPETVFQLRIDNTWTYRVMQRGQLVRETQGTLPVKTAVNLRAHLASATWTTGHAEVRCMAYSANYREYRVRGVLVYTQRLCDGQVLDDASAAALAEANALVGPLVGPLVRE